MVPIIYYTTEILSVIDEAIEDGIRNYDDMYEADKEKLVVYCMNALKNDAEVFIINSEKMDDIVSCLKAVLMTGSAEDAMDLSQTIVDGAIEKLDQIMPDLFNERLAELQADLHRESGHHLVTDSQTGEQHWVK